MITSGLFLHICVGAMLIMKTEKKLKNYDAETNTSKLNIEDNETVRNKLSIRYITIELFSSVHFIFVLASAFSYYFGVSVMLTFLR